jgi:hypothetical protein
MSAYQEERQKERERDRLEREKDRLEPGWRERKKAEGEREEAKRVRVNEVESKIVLAFAIGGGLIGGVFAAQVLFPFASFDAEDMGLGVVVLVTFSAFMDVFVALICGLIGGYVGGFVADYVGCWLRARDE